MLIHISSNELELEFRDLCRSGLITQASIDYADNAIYAIYEGRQVIVFKFKEYGWVNDNRYNNYQASIGAAGIIINIQKL